LDENAKTFVSRQKRILIADDHASNQLFLRMRLRELGHDVKTVSSGRQAYEAVLAIPFDLVLMDLKMPELDGFETTRLIRKAEARGARRVPVVGLSLDQDSELQKKCMEAGMDGLLLKPVDDKNFLKTVTRFLTKATP